MDSSHLRGPQPPTSHVVPGAPGVTGHPPHIGFIEPPFIFPTSLLTEIIKSIHNEFLVHGQFIRDQHHDMNSRFELTVRQTDRILTEQYARFELSLESIRKDMRQFHESQTAAIADLGTRLDALEGLTESSRDGLASKIADIVEAMGHGFDGLVEMIKNNECSESPQPPSPYVSELVRTCSQPLDAHYPSGAGCLRSLHR